MDSQQLAYSTFEVPDPGRIDKVERLVRKAALKKGRRCNVLEFGACTGGLVHRLAGDDGFDCYGIDINDRSLPGVKFFKADANREFPDMAVQGFDFIFAGEFLEHLHDDKDFLLRCRRMLNRDGYLLLTVPNLFFSLNRIIMLFGRMPYFSTAPGHYHIYSKKKITELLAEAGYAIEEVRASHVLFPARTPAISLPKPLMLLFGTVFEKLGDIFPSVGAHLIVFSRNNA